MMAALNRTTVPLTTTPSSTLQVFHVDFIDTPEFHTRIEQILQGGSIEPGHGFQPSTTTEPPEDEGISTLSLSLIIPLCVISFFMMVVGICMMCNACYRRKMRSPPPPEVTTNSYRANLDWHESIRSNRLAAIRATEGSKLKLDKIPEVHENPVVDDGVFSPSDSLVSYISNLRLDMANNSRHKIPHHSLHSHHHHHHQGDMSHSYPNLVLSAQAPFSPYRLTWVTPNPEGHMSLVQSDPHSLHRLPGGARRPETTAGRRQSVTAVPAPPIPEDSVFTRRPMEYSSSWKSPYHPNHNTPTDGSEGDAMILPPNVYVNRMSTTSADPPPPYSPHDTPRTDSGTPTTTPVLSMVTEGRQGSHMTRNSSRSSPGLLQSIQRSLERSGSAVFLPQNEPHFDRVYSFPEGDERMMYDMSRMMMSSQPLPYSHCPSQFCQVCGKMEENYSMCPLAGSYPTTMYHHQGFGPSTNVSYQTATSGMSGGYSVNSSMAVGPADSGDTTPYDTSTTGTAQPSEHSSSVLTSYTAEPSHSTSLGLPSTLHSSTMRSSNPSTGIHGLSAIRQGSTASTTAAGGDSQGVMMSSSGSAAQQQAALARSAPAVLGSLQPRKQESGHLVGAAFNHGMTEADLAAHMAAEESDGDAEVDGPDTSPASRTDSSIRSVMLNSFCPVPVHPRLDDLREAEGEDAGGDHTPDGSRAGTPGAQTITPVSCQWDAYPFYNHSGEGSSAGQEMAVDVSEEMAADIAVQMVGDVEEMAADIAVQMVADVQEMAVDVGEVTEEKDEEDAGHKEGGTPLERASPRRRSGQPVLKDKRYWV